MEGGAAPGTTQSRSAAAQSISRRTPYLGEDPREPLLSTPLAEEILRFAAEVFTPTVDSLGRLHVSFLGRGDFILSRSDSDTPPRSLESSALDSGTGSAGPRWAPPPAPALLPPTPGLDEVGPLTVGEFLLFLAREVLAFAFHPLTLLAAFLGTLGYVVVRLALERSRRRGRPRERGHQHHHRPSRHHHARTRHNHARHSHTHHGPSHQA